MAVLASHPSPNLDEPPLVVALSSLLLTGCVAECLLAIARRRPLRLLAVPAWLLRGRAYFMQQLTRYGMPEFETFPVHTALLGYLRRQHAAGRRLILVSNVDLDVCQELAMRWGIFDSVVASTPSLYMSKRRLLERLTLKCGSRGFDYVGSHASDLPLWQAAREGVVAGHSSSLRRRAGAATRLVGVFGASAAPKRELLSAMRIEHWVKNSLVLLPLLAAPGRTDTRLAVLLFLMFLSLCWVSSSVYLLNDLLDLESDRLHPHNKHRALASGRLPLSDAFTMAIVLLVGALLVSLVLPLAATAVVAAYFCLICAYSLGLKKIPILDALLLSCGYVLRAIAGAVVANLAINVWMCAFCLAIFFGLALLKRYVDLSTTPRHYTDSQAGYGYWTADRIALMAQGIGSGYLSIPLLCAYLISARIQAPQPFLLLLLCALLFYWVSYLWLRAARNTLPRDAITFVFHDRASLALLTLMAPLIVIT